MFEFHGWATLRATAGALDDAYDEQRDATAAHTVLGLIDDVRRVAAFTGGQLVVEQVNGAWQVWLHGLRNHRQDRVVELFSRIAAAAPGSYGLLHFRDDEADDPERWNCATMCRGQVALSTESRLTPHCDLIEDLPSYEA